MKLQKRLSPLRVRQKRNTEIQRTPKRTTTPTTTCTVSAFVPCCYLAVSNWNLRQIPQRAHDAWLLYPHFCRWSRMGFASASISGQSGPVSAALQGWIHPAVQIRLEGTFEGAIKRKAATPVLNLRAYVHRPQLPSLPYSSLLIGKVAASERGSGC